MSRLLLDTNAYSALMSGNLIVGDALSTAGVVLMTPVVLGELLDGFAGGTKNKENRFFLERFCAKPRTSVISITRETSEWFALIKQQLKRKGTPIPINDVWIAASCLEHGAQLLTFDAHFSQVEGLLRWST